METNGVHARLNTLERQMERLLNLEPAAMKAQLEDVKEDIRDMKEDASSRNKILTGFLITFAVTVMSALIGLWTVMQAH